MIRFSVYGEPKPQGNVRAFKSIVVQGGTKDQRAALASWRTLVVDAARSALMKRVGQGFPKSAPVGVRLTFYVTRPKSRPKNRFPYPVTKPDLDKLVRGFGDAIKGLITDDSDICASYARKLYADDRTPGLDAEVWMLADNPCCTAASLGNGHASNCRNA